MRPWPTSYIPCWPNVKPHLALYDFLYTLWSLHSFYVTPAVLKWPKENSRLTRCKGWGDLGRRREGRGHLPPKVESGHVGAAAEGAMGEGHLGKRRERFRKIKIIIIIINNTIIFHLHYNYEKFLHCHHLNHHYHKYYLCYHHQHHQLYFHHNQGITSITKTFRKN